MSDRALTSAGKHPGEEQFQNAHKYPILLGSCSVLLASCFNISSLLKKTTLIEFAPTAGTAGPTIGVLTRAHVCTCVCTRALHNSLQSQVHLKSFCSMDYFENVFSSGALWLPVRKKRKKKFCLTGLTVSRNPFSAAAFTTIQTYGFPGSYIYDKG